MKSLTDTQLSYLAGLLDGEGCLMIANTRGASRYIPELNITMTHERTIRTVADWLEVPVKLVKRSNPKPHWKQQYALRMSGKRVAALCKLLLPYLITKHGQAELVIAFAKTYIKQGGPSVRVPAAVFAKRKRLQGRVHRLNRPNLHPNCFHLHEIVE